jgi:hypothetical protein
MGLRPIHQGDNGPIPGTGNGVHLDTALGWKGVAPSSSLLQSDSQGDEDIAAPFPFSNGVATSPSPFRSRSPAADISRSDAEKRGQGGSLGTLERAHRWVTRCW